MNDMPDLTYKWPEYLRSLSDGTIPASFLSPLAGKGGKICHALKGEPILRDREEKLVKPTELLSVPPRFLTRKSTPLLESFEPHALLSIKYEESITPVLSWLGVSRLDEILFVKKLGQTSRTILKQKGVHWHEDLAQCLNAMGNERPPEVENIPLVPLRNGMWVSGKELRRKHAFYDSDDLKLPAPMGTNLRLVDKKVVSNQHRKALCKSLGVKACTAQVVCKAILNDHKATERPQLSPEELIDHAIYLFSYKDFVEDPKDLRFLWLADSHFSCSRGSSLYIDDPGSEFAISEVLHDDDHLFPFVHPGYLEPPTIHEDNRGAFVDWLQEELGVCSLPRLASKTTTGIAHNKDNPLRHTVSLTEDFKQIIATNPSSTFLKILIENWDYYFREAEFKLSIKANSTEIMKQLSCQEVDTSLGKWPLNSTFLKVPKLEEIARDMDVPDVPWLTVDLIAIDVKISQVSSIMAKFGVGVVPCVSFFLSLLRNLQSRPSTHDKLVHKLYRRLNKHLASPSKNLGASLVSEMEFVK